MAKTWFEIDPATSTIKAWTRSSGADALPSDTAKSCFVEADDALVAQYEALVSQAVGDGRDTSLKLVDGVPALPADPRPACEASIAPVEASAGDLVSIALTADDSKFSGRVVHDFAGRLLGFDFSGGVATKQLTMPTSGRFRFASSSALKIKTAVDITVTE